MRAILRAGKYPHRTVESHGEEEGRRLSGGGGGIAACEPVDSRVENDLVRHIPLGLLLDRIEDSVRGAIPGRSRKRSAARRAGERVFTP